MPFVRDFAYNYITTAATTIVAPMPAYEQNDLIVAILTSDGPQTSTSVTATGWTQLGYWDQTGTNACSCNILAKYATASEADVTFTLASETHNVTLITIGDVFQGTITSVVDAATANYTNSTSFTAVRQGYPALTTTGPDRLILYTAVASTNIQPSVLEGPVFGIIGKDGNSHADGFGWGYKKTAGTIAANSVYASCVGTAAPAGHLIQLAIKPPASGALVVPGYCVSDASKLANILTGAAATGAYGANTATAALASFAGSISGKTISAAGATYTYADTGLNTYHASVGILGLTTSGTWAGNETGLATIADAAGKNILFHVGPQLPVDIQTTDSVALTGTNGLSIALGTSSGNWKAWHIAGSGTSFGAQRYQPVVVNTSNTTGVLQSTGTFNASSITKLGVFLSGKVVAPKWVVSSMWVLDTTVVAGGLSTANIELEDIISAASTGKERRSITSQGAGQALIYQPLQLGTGSTNDPIYVNLSNNAIEFPKQYSKATKQVNYCSVNNVCGITFNLTSSDIVDLRNTAFSSANKYHWKWLGYGSAYTSGCQVINAGTISLAANTNLDGVGFTSCDQITLVSTTANIITGCTFKSSTTSTGAVKISSASSATLQALLDSLSLCSFVSNNIALLIEYTGAGNVSLNISSGIFSGNTTDVSWSAGAGQTLTLNISGTTSGLTTTSTTNGTTVNLVNQKTKTITNIPSGAEIRVRRGAYTLAYQANIVSGSYAYNYTADNRTSTVVVTKPGLVIEPLEITQDSTNSSVAIVYSPDPSYSAS